MRRQGLLALIVIAALCFAFAAAAAPAEAAHPLTVFDAAVLAVGGGEQVIYEKEPAMWISSGSMSLLMTALVAYEAFGMERLLTVDVSAIGGSFGGARSLSLQDGEQLLSGDVIAAVLMNAYNDAAALLSANFEGGIPAFVERMNTRAQELGMADTYFSVPTEGSGENNHISPRDAVALYRVLWENPPLKEQLSRQRRVIPATAHFPQRVIWSSNSLTSRFYHTDLLYSYAVGGKAGDGIAIATAVKGDIELIVFVCGGENERARFAGMAKAFDLCFQDYTLKTIVKQGAIVRETRLKNGAGSDRLLLHADRTLRLLLQKDDSLEDIQEERSIPEEVAAPVEKNRQIGAITYRYAGRLAGRVGLISHDEVPVSPYKLALSTLAWFFSLGVVRAVLVLLAGFLVFYIILLWRVVKGGAKKNRRRR